MKKSIIITVFTMFFLGIALPTFSPPIQVCHAGETYRHFRNIDELLALLKPNSANYNRFRFAYKAGAVSFSPKNGRQWERRVFRYNPNILDRSGRASEIRPPYECWVDMNWVRANS